MSGAVQGDGGGPAQALEGAFDWPGLLHAGCHELGLKPWEFWCLTPAELELLIGRARPGAGVGIGRARLDELARRYPDSNGRFAPDLTALDLAAPDLVAPNPTAPRPDTKETQP